MGEVELFRRLEPSQKFSNFKYPNQIQPNQNKKNTSELNFNVSLLNFNIQPITLDPKNKNVSSIA